VESAGIVGDLFIGGNPEQIVTAEGTPDYFERLRFRRDEVSGGFFKALGTPLLRGASFRSRMGLILRVWQSSMMRWLAACGLGAIQSARDSSSALGFRQAVVYSRRSRGDMRRQGLESEPIPQMFEPLVQNPSRLATLLVRTSMDDPLKMVGRFKLPCVGWRSTRRSMP